MPKTLSQVQPRFGLTALFLLLACTPRLVLAQYRFDHWTADNGLPQNSVRDIRQTRDGYLWLATSDGLVRFDGVRFTTFDKSHTPGLTSNRFACLYEAPDGVLWAGTENGGLTRYDHGTFTTYTTEHGLPHNDAKRITSDEAGQFWVLSADRIMRWDQGRFVLADLKGVKISFQPSSYSRQAFFGADKTNIYRFAHGELTAWPLPSDLLSQCNYRFEEDPSGTLWMGLRDGRVARIKDGRVLNIFRASDVLPDKRTGIIANPDTRAEYRNRQGHLLTMSMDDVLTRTLTLPSAGQLEKVAFISFCEDREGNLWLGTAGQGLYRVRKPAVTTYSQPEGLVDRNVYPIYQDNTGAIWIGAWNSGVSRFKDGRFASFTPRDGLASVKLTAISEDRDGRLWVSGHNPPDGGLRVLSVGRQDGRFTDPGVKVPFEIVRAAAIHQDTQGVFWFGTQRGLVRYQNGAATLYTMQDGLAGNDVSVIIENTSGALWIGTNGGLTRYLDGKFTSYTERDGLPGGAVRSLYQDREGVLWIGTYDGGLGRFEDGRLTRYTVKDGLFNNGVFQILEDARGNFWMSSNRGIHRVSKQELNEFAAGKRSTITSIAYGKSDGMLNIECNGGVWPAGIKARDGKLWFPTQDGVAVIDPETISINSQPPPVVIEAVAIDRNQIAFGSGVEVSPSQTSLDITYTALSLSKSELIRFKYKMEGLSGDWIEAGARRTAYYSYLPPGAYTFRVIAANSDGVWNTEGQSLRIVVVPPFYRTWWFITLVALSVIGLIVFAYQYRVRQLERAQAAQQAFSRQLIASQESERKRIASELHDSLGQSLVIIRNWALLGSGQLPAQAPAKEELDEITATASRAIKEVREIAYNLGPHHLDRLGLAKTIQEMVNRLVPVSSIRFTTDLDSTDGALSREVELNLYRIAQEALNNLVKHAQATEAQVRLKREAEGVKLTVADNGQGFDPHLAASSAHQGGFGLTGMAERVRLLNGALAVHSAPGAGTTIEVTFGDESRP